MATRYSALDVVAVACDPGDGGFAVAQLLDDVLLGFDTATVVGVVWFEPDGGKAIGSYSAGAEDQTTAGRLICRIKRAAAAADSGSVDITAADHDRILRKAAERDGVSEDRCLQHYAAETDAESDGGGGEEEGGEEDCEGDGAAVAAKGRGSRKRAGRRVGGSSRAKRTRRAAQSNAAEESDEDWQAEADGPEEETEDEKDVAGGTAGVAGAKGGRRSRARSVAGGRKKGAKKAKVGGVHGVGPRPGVVIPARDPWLDDPAALAEDAKDDPQMLRLLALAHVRAGSSEALEALTAAGEHQHFLHGQQSVHNPRRAVDEAALRGDEQALLRLAADLSEHGAAQGPSLPPVDLPRQDTGGHTGVYRYRNRAIGVGKGGKEGNNALLHDTHVDGRPMLTFTRFSNAWRLAFTAAAAQPEVEPQRPLLERLLANERFAGAATDGIRDCVVAGNHEAALLLIRRFRAIAGFNALHEEALTLRRGGKLSNTRQPSILKKPSAYGMRPLHVACISPGGEALEQMLAAAPEYGLEDLLGHQPTHYAAASRGSGPMRVLLASGRADFTAKTKGTRYTPLYLAAEAGRAHNVALLVWRLRAGIAKLDEAAKGTIVGAIRAGDAVRDAFDAGDTAGTGMSEEQEDAGEAKDGAEAGTASATAPGDDGSADASLGIPCPEEGSQAKRLLGVMLRAKPRDLSTALHAAAARGHIACMDVLLAAGMKPDAAGLRRVTAVMCAAATGQQEAVEFLLERGGAVDRVDARGRTALMHACMNGATRVVALLLARGADTEKEDTSGNTAAHYAAAYGWLPALRLLEHVGAGLDRANTWQLTPSVAALTKRHPACASLLLRHPRVDVNARDERGLTVAARICASSGSEHLPLLRFLLDEKGADACTRDEQDRTPLHHIAPRDPGQWRAPGVADFDLEAARLLLDKGAPVDACDLQGRTPLAYALLATPPNMELAALLLERGASVRATDEALQRGSDGLPRLDRPSLLLHAVRQGGEDMVTLLMGAGKADAHGSPFDPESPLYAAVKTRKKALVAQLLAKGAAAPPTWPSIEELVPSVPEEEEGEAGTQGGSNAAPRVTFGDGDVSDASSVDEETPRTAVATELARAQRLYSVDFGRGPPAAAEAARNLEHEACEGVLQVGTDFAEAEEAEQQKRGGSAEQRHRSGGFGVGMGGWATPHGRSRMRVRASMSSRFGQRAGDPEQHRGGDKRRTRREVIETLTSLHTELRTGALLETARSMAPELLRDLLRGGADPAVVSRAGDNVLHALCGAVAQVADPRKPSLVGRLEALFAEVDAPRIAAMAQQRNKAGMAPTHLLAQGLAALTDADLANPATRQRLTAVYAFAATRFPKDAWCMAVDLGEAAEAEQNHLARAVRRLARAVQRRARVKGRIKALWTQAKRAHEAGGAGAVEEEEDEEGGEVGAEGDASAPVEEEEEEEEGGGRFEPESAGSGSDSERDGFESGHSGDEEEEGAGTGGDGSGEAKRAVDGQSHPAVSNMGYQALKEELRRLEGVVQRRRQRCDRLVRSLGRMQCVLWRGASPAHLLLTSRAGRGCVLAPLGGMEGGTEGVAPLPQRALVAAGGAHGGTVLHMASAMGAVGIVQALLATPEGRAALEAASTRDGSTALVAAAAHGRVSCARTLLGAGASVAARDSHRQTALHLAVLAGSAEIVGAVLAAGAEVDAVDNWASTPLMLAVARTVGASDVSYEIVNSLLDTRPNMGLCDAHGRTALHYAFAPRGDVTALRGRGGALPERDPVETVSSVCAAEGVAVDAADAFGSTPLHYACALGASTSALLLLARGASITALNSDVNAPLGLAALWQRWQFMVAVIPHAKEAVTLPVWHVTAKGMGGGGSDPPAAAALLGRTTKRVATTLLFEAMLHGSEGAAYLLLEQGYPMSRAVADALRAGAFRRALALATKARRQEDLHCRSEDGSTLLHLVAQAKGRGFDEKWSVPLAHLFLRRGVLEGKTASNGRTALHDAANRGHSKLCGVLLDVEGETSAADRLSRVDAAGATPLALALAQWRVRTALALVRAGAHVNTRSVEGRHSLAHLAVHRGDVGKLAAVLALPGRDPSLTDALGRTALHYAVAKGSVRLARMLLEAGAAAETADLEGVTPFGVLVQTLVRAGRASRSAAELMGLLLRAGASPSTSVDTTWFDYSGDTRAKRPAPEPGSPPPDPRLTRTTLLHTVLRWREEGRVREDAMALLAVACWQGAQPAVADGTGDSALIVAIRANAEASLRVMLGDEETAKDAWAAAPESISSALAAGLGVSPLLGLPGAGVGAEAVTEAVAAPDAKGRSPLHVVVSPMPCGSFENDRLLRLLVARGAPVEAKDAAGKTAMFYAGQQASGVMRAALREVGARAVPTMRRAQSLIASWPPAEVDWEADAAEMLGKLRGEGEGAASVRVPPVFSAFAKERDAAVVVHDGAIFDVLLTKVDLRSGPMGSNDFYHIQLVRLPAKRRHVLLTRWGRVGDVVGQYQQEALRTEGEGRESFAKVFEAKTGMAWAEARADPRQCDPVPGKFRPVQQDRFRALQGNENALALDWERAPATALPKPMAEAMRPLMDVPSLRWSLQSTGLDAARMPLGKMRREALEEARTLLTEMLPMAEELEGSVRGAMAATASPEEAAAAVERQRELREELAWRSERFYELVPHKDGLDNVLEPIATERAVRDKVGLVSNLLDLHVSVRLVLGAMLRQHESNPLDYCFSALNISLEHLAPGADALGDERDMLLSYMDRSSPGLSRRVANVFRLQRKDEGSRMEQWREATNHLLLWHGTRTSNVMSILSQGLRIAPPEAPRSGAKYGRGLYFADTARKSIMYATPVGGSLFLLLAEVAVGNPYLPRKMEYMESAPEGFHSTKARGCKEPVPPGTVKMGNGVAVALGEIAEAEVPEDGMRWCWSREEPGAEGPRKWRAFPDKAWQRVEEAWRKGEQRVEMEWQLRHERVASVIDMVNMVETRTRLQAAWSRNRASKHVVEKRKLPARLYFAEEENEFIVYDESQIRLRYVVQLRE